MKNSLVNFIYMIMLKLAGNYYGYSMNENGVILYTLFLRQYFRTYFLYPLKNLIFEEIFYSNQIVFKDLEIQCLFLTSLKRNLSLELNLILPVKAF